MAKQTRWIAIIVIVCLIDLGLWLWLSNVPRKALGGPVVVTVHPAAEPQSQAQSDRAMSSLAAASEPASTPLPVPAGAKSPLTMAMALDELFGSKVAQSMFQTADFVQRFVITVDKLGRAKAPSRLWPMVPMPGPFLVDWQGGSGVIGIDNGLRYTPYVLLLETVDLHRAVQIYAELYPQFQRAYEEQGFAGQSFHERLLAVMDQLLSAPDLNVAPKVHLPVPVGATGAAKPWVLYQFDDPALEAANAGQKIMIRMGAVNQRRVKAKLAELRRLLHDLGAQG